MSVIFGIKRMVILILGRSPFICVPFHLLGRSPCIYTPFHLLGRSPCIISVGQRPTKGVYEFFKPCKGVIIIAVALFLMIPPLQGFDSFPTLRRALPYANDARLSAYQLVASLPQNFKASLPGIKEIEAELADETKPRQPTKNGQPRKQQTGASREKSNG